MAAMEKSVALALQPDIASSRAPASIILDGRWWRHLVQPKLLAVWRKLVQPKLLKVYRELLQSELRAVWRQPVQHIFFLGQLVQPKLLENMKYKIILGLVKFL